MDFYTYMLRCSDGSYYVGHTDDIDARFAQHQSGAVAGYTQKRRPVALVWCERFPDRDQAFTAERRIKNWPRAKKEALIQSDWEALREAARKPAFRSGASLDTGSRQARPLLGMSGEDSIDEMPEHTEATTSPLPQPVIVLVRPQLGENIGKAARAMLNFGLTEMRLVSPRDGWPNPAAGPAASGADIVLERATVYETVAEAVADCPNVFATTVRKRGVTKPVVTPEQAADAVHLGPGKSAILFGPERSGLETEDVALARTIVTVPINPEFGSLNLAQAVILIAYEWSKRQELAVPTATEALPPAPQAELEDMILHLEALLEKAGYFYPPDRAPATRRTLRGLLTKPAWNSLEVRTLRGVLSAIERPRER